MKINTIISSIKTKNNMYKLKVRASYAIIVLLYLALILATPFIGLESASATFFGDAPLTNYPTVGNSQTIYSTVEAEDGSLYIGGLFNSIGGVARNNLARILADGTVDASFNPDVNGEVRTLKIDNESNTLFIGGNFTFVNGSTSRTNIAALDSVTGTARSLNVSTSGTVYSLELNSDASTLYVGGSFNNTYDDYTSTIDAVAIDSSNNRYLLDATNSRIVKLDSNNSFITQWGSEGSGDGEFYYPTDIVVDSLNNVYVTDEGNGRIQKFDSDGTYLTKWGAIGSGDGEFSEISSITIDTSDNVYVADPDNARIQKFDSDGTYITQWGVFGSGNGEFSDLRSVSADQSGNIYTMEGLSGNNRIQKFDSNGVYSSEWALPLGNSYDITTNVDGNVYLATDYTTINSYSSTGDDLGSWQAGDGTLNRMALIASGTSVYVATINSNYAQQFSTQSGHLGELTSTIYGSKQRQDLVAFDISTGVVTNFNAIIESCSGGGTVYSLDYESDDNSLYIGGHISTVQNENRNGMAKVNAVTGVLNADFNPYISWEGGTDGVCSEVYDISVHDNKVYAGGNFNRVNEGATVRNNLAVFDTDDGVVDGGFNPNIRGTVHALAFDGSGVIYAGGTFTKVNGTVSRPKLSSFRVSDGRVTLFDPSMDTSSTVYSLSIANDGSKLFSGGSFDSVGGTQRRGLAVFAQTACTYVNFFAPAPSEGASVPLYSQSIGAQKTDGQFLRYYSPGDMAVDATGNVYVVDQEQEAGGTVSQILKYSSSGAFILKFGSFGTGDGQFNTPQRIVVDSSGNVYVVDSGNNRIQKFDSNGVYTTKWGSTGSGDGQFDRPISTTLDTSENIVVTDASNSRIQIFTNNGSYISKFNSGSAYSVEVNSSNNFYVSTTDGVSIYDSAGILIETLGEPILGSSSVHSLAIDIADDSIYVADVINARVRKLSADHDNLLQWGTPAYESDNQLYQPLASNYVVGNDGKIYVQLNGGIEPEIKIYAPNGNLLDRWTGSQYSAGGIAVDDDGNVYTTYFNSVRKFNSAGDMVQEMFVNTNGSLSNPTAIVVDSSNNFMYVVDTDNSRVVKLSLDGDTLDMEYGFAGVRTIALSASGESIYVINGNIKEYTSSNLDLINQWGTTGTGNGQFINPTGIDTDETGNIYIADAGNNRIQKYSYEGYYLSKWGSDGSSDGQFRFYGDYPRLGVNVDNADNVWVADTYNNRIQKFSYTPNDPDYDNDGTPDSEEIEAINDGDGNNDCELDAEQENVSSLLNDQLGGYITIVGPNGSRFVSSDTLEATNTSDQYPFGIFSFVLDGISVGGEVEINVFVDNNENDPNLVVRNYFPSTKTYLDIPGATVTSESINSQNVLHVTYKIKDGSIFDLDGVANGSITDPAGMAVLGASTSRPSSPVSRLLQSTGNSIFTRLIFSLSLISLVYSVSKRKSTTSLKPKR